MKNIFLPNATSWVIRSLETSKEMKRSLHKILVSVIFFLSYATSNAQTWPFEIWHEGKIVRVEGDTIRGLVKYDLAQDLVQLAHGDKNADVYSARKVLYFEIFDASVSRYRKFYTLPFAIAGEYKTPIFFELLTEGKVTLLAREFLESKTVSSAYYVGASRIVLSHKYFFLDSSGTIEQFTGKRNDFLDRFGKKSKDVEKYMRTNHLQFGEKEDMRKIVAYYNSLVEI
jgi:hypothetical protein